MIILFITIYCIDFRISINKCSMFCNHAKNISIYKKRNRKLPNEKSFTIACSIKKWKIIHKIWWILNQEYYTSFAKKYHQLIIYFVVIVKRCFSFCITHSWKWGITKKFFQIVYRSYHDTYFTNTNNLNTRPSIQKNYYYYTQFFIYLLKRDNWIEIWEKSPFFFFFF